MKIEEQGISEIGRMRDENQDAMLIDRQLGLFVVCDGMRGQAAGRAAAETAVSTIHESVRAALRKSDSLATGTASHHELREVPSKAMDDACLEIHRRATSDFQYVGVGCTATKLLISGQKAAMTHVGDASLYLCRDGKTERVDLLHTRAGEMIRAGALACR